MALSYSHLVASAVVTRSSCARKAAAASISAFVPGRVAAVPTRRPPLRHCAHAARLFAGRPDPPPDYTIVSDDDDAGDLDGRRKGSSGSGTSSNSSRSPSSRRVRGVASMTNNSKKDLPPMTASWMDRNVAGRWQDSEDKDQSRRSRRASNPNDGNDGEDEEKSRNFRDDFRGTRVFVQGLPPHVMWQELKDHFGVAGEVVFASVSNDRQTGKSKGCGVVQYENTDMARNAIKVMRDHPLDGSTLYVREDFQEQRGGGGDRTLSDRGKRYDRSGSGGGRNNRNNPNREDSRSMIASTWRCANDEGVDTQEERDAILDLVQERDTARRDRDYDASDAMREELKIKFDVHLDDRLKMWWKSVDGSVPDAVADVKGGGRWEESPKAKQPWRQIPTTHENDACVDSDRVDTLLKQRDAARKKKDFRTADDLLEQARTAPDGDLCLRIHDESRTWRIWTDAPPPRRPARDQDRGWDQDQDQDYDDGERVQLSASEQCLALVTEHDPEKMDEVKMLLGKFPGREYNILKKLKQRYGG